MWLYDVEMQSLGFRRRGDRYWQCEHSHGLSGHDHVSVFSWSEHRLLHGGYLVELTEFHVTLYRAGERLHFYYHLHDENEWRHEGNTSYNEIRRLSLDPAELRAEAEAVALALVLALGGKMVSRAAETRRGSE